MLKIIFEEFKTFILRPNFKTYKKRSVLYGIGATAQMSHLNPSEMTHTLGTTTSYSF